MSGPVRIRLHPQSVVLEVARGTPLRDVLFPHGVEFPCGGRGQCDGCRVRVLEGRLAVTDIEADRLGPEELAAGWRLACRHTAGTHLTLEVAQWDTPILADETLLDAAPREGLGIAMDIGTTTVAAQLLDLTTGRVLAVETALNPQARFGADIMSRVEAALETDGAAALTASIRQLGGTLATRLLEASGAPPDRVRDVVAVGNTVMHHLFCGHSVRPLAHHPFASPDLGPTRLAPGVLGWPVPACPAVRFMPCIGGHVGSDVLAGVFALDLARRERPAALIDLGTNGEVVVGRRGRLLCGSTAAGPAFEGARVRQGMRAATGAIAEVTLDGGRPVARVLGDAAARGVCGSGLVDAAAVFLELGRIRPSGRLDDPQASLALTPAVCLTGADIRELQLAKGAVAAGLRILMDRLGLSDDELETIHLAGAFGNYVNPESAVRIGLLPPPASRARPAGNSALRGAKLALFTEEPAWERLAREIEHVPLHTHARFEEIYADALAFPG